MGISSFFAGCCRIEAIYSAKNWVRRRAMLWIHNERSYDAVRSKEKEAEGKNIDIGDRFPATKSELVTGFQQR